MMWLFNLIVGSRLGRLVGTVLGALGMILLVFIQGGRAQKRKAELRELKHQKEMRRRVDEVDVNVSRDVALKRLRNNGDLREPVLPPEGPTDSE